MLPSSLEHTIPWIVQLGIQKRLLYFSATLYLIALCRERFKWDGFAYNMDYTRGIRAERS